MPKRLTGPFPARIACRGPFAVLRIAKDIWKVTALLKIAAFLISLFTLVGCATPPDSDGDDLPRLVYQFGAAEPGLTRTHMGRNWRLVGASGHIGVGFAAEVGAPVYAVAEGRVQAPGPVGQGW